MGSKSTSDTVVAQLRALCKHNRTMSEVFHFLAANADRDREFIGCRRINESIFVDRLNKLNPIELIEGFTKLQAIGLGTVTRSRVKGHFVRFETAKTREMPDGISMRSISQVAIGEAGELQRYVSTAGHRPSVRKATLYEPAPVARRGKSATDVRLMLHIGDTVIPIPHDKLNDNQLVAMIRSLASHL